MELTGKRLGGKYEVQGELGRGGMGVVYRGYDHELQRTVAIKVLSTQLASFPDFVQRFRHEAVAAANLHHSNIVTVYDVGRERSAIESRDVHFLVMEYIDGETLDQWVRRQRRAMSLDETDLILQQVAAALQYAHDRGMVHRDIKPSNIMMSASSQVKLMDFGLVRAAEMSTITQTGTVLGTPLYMAPEQVTGAQIDRRADIYSLGIVIYELLAGEVPFMRTTPLAVAHAHVYDPPPPLGKKRPDLPQSVESVVLKALAKEPSARFPDALSLSRQFSLAIAGRSPVPPTVAYGGASTKPPKAAPPIRPGLRGRSPLIWLGAIVGLIVMAVIAVALMRNDTPPGGASGGPIVEPTASSTAARAALPIPEPDPATQTPTSTASPPDAPAVVTPTEAATSTAIAKPPTATPLLDPIVRIAGDGVVNVRNGPGTDYQRVGQVSGGSTFDIVGRNADSSWLQICCVAGNAAWIAASLVQTSGDLQDVATVEVPAISPTKPPPPAGVVSQTYPVPLQSVSTVRTTNGYIDPPLGDVILGGIRFELGQGSSVTTQASSLPNNPTSVMLPVSIDSPQAVYLLLTGGNMYSEFNGQDIGTIRLLFDDGLESTVTLTAGRNIREWKHFDQSVVQSLSSPDVTEVWRGANRYDSGTAVIDMLQIALPPNLQTHRLTGIELIDSSSRLTGSMDPAVNLLGVTVIATERSATPTPAPTPAPTPVPATATPAPVACATTPGPSFAQWWNRQKIGCATSNEVGVTSAYETFEHGWMLWRQDNDGLYAIYDDGSYDVFFYPSAEPPQFSCVEAQQLDRPQRGFSMVWCQNPAVRSRLGNALDYEIGDSRPLQNFEQGYMVYINERGHVYAIHADRTWQQVN